MQTVCITYVVFFVLIFLITFDHRPDPCAGGPGRRDAAVAALAVQRKHRDRGSGPSCQADSKPVTRSRWRLAAADCQSGQ